MKYILRLLFCIFIIHSLKNVNADIIKSISVSENSRITKDAIINFSGLKKGQNFDKYTLNNALKQIYRSGNFADVKIINSNEDIGITVLETPVVGDVFITGDYQFDADTVKKSLLTKSLQVYSKSRIKMDMERLQLTMKKMGFLNIKIEPRVVFLENNAVDVIFNINEGKMSYINDIIFEGNKNVSNRKLKSIILSKPRSVFTISSADGAIVDENIDKDVEMIETFYKNHGYAKAKVVNAMASFDKQDYDFILHYKIEEGNLYTFGNSSINSSLHTITKDSLFLDIIKLKQGQRFSLETIEKTKRKIVEYLNARGFSNIQPKHELIFNDEDKIVDVEYTLDIGQKVYIDKIKISGNHKTFNNVILREMMISEGDLYDKDKINLSRDRIYMLGYFKNVEIKENPIANSDLIDLEIIVEEQFFGRINLSIGYSGYYGIVGNIGLSINNFLGRGYGVSIGIDRSGFMESYSIGFFNPYMFSDKYNIGLGVNANFSRFGDIGGGTKYISNLLYKGYSYSGSISVSFELANRLTLTTTIGISKYLYKMLGSYSYQLYEQLLGTRNSQYIGLSLTYNKMNRVRFATKGYLLRYGVTFGGIGITGGQQFIQNTASAIGNIPIIGEDLYLHIEANGGILNNLNKNNIIGMENLFTLGGYTRMRGFDFYGIGPRIQKIAANGITSTLYYATEGNKYYYLTAEFRTPLFIPKDYGVYFSAFIDAGAVWGFAGISDHAKYTTNDIEYREIIKDSSRMRVSGGLGITWQSPMFGEIGFYYAKPFVKQTYDTTLEFGIKMGANF